MSLEPQTERRAYNGGWKGERVFKAGIPVGILLAITAVYFTATAAITTNEVAITQVQKEVTVTVAKVASNTNDIQELKVKQAVTEIQITNIENMCVQILQKLDRQ